MSAKDSAALKKKDDDLEETQTPSQTQIAKTQEVVEEVPEVPLAENEFDIK